MAMISRWVEQIWNSGRVAASDGQHQAESERFEALIRAQGSALALLAVILEREGIIGSGEFAESLNGFADVTAADYPKVGDILSLWASCVRDTALARHESPSIQ